MCAFPQLVSAPLNPIPILEHYMSDADISGIASITICQVTDLNFPQLIACLNYLAHVLALGTISSKPQLKRKLQTKHIHEVELKTLFFNFV